MMKQLLAGLAVALVATPAWTSETGKAPKEEKIGVGSGAMIGAIAGGPIGMVLGAALGGWTGDRFHQQRARREAAETALADVSAERDSLESELRNTEREVGTLRAMNADDERRFKAALEDALEVQVYFHTEQSTLDTASEERLARIAGLIDELGDVAVVIEGYADSRGEVEYNEQLSAARAATVRDTLLRAGVPMDQITVHAVGETQSSAAETDTDALALERKVSLTIVRPSSTLVGELR
ncbi:MAG TPA: OmpA family protein [Gammaproteobacteria bacterium]|jgi:outer membrane protein OmpA-like peptidoglycan-associated protein